MQATSQDSGLFFVLSGEHPSLPAAEVKAILESTGVEYVARAQSYRLLTLKAPLAALKAVSERSLMYDWCGLLLGECQGDEDQVLKLVKDQPIEELSRNSTSFAVRSVRLGGSNKAIRRTSLERDIGSVVKDVAPRLKVQLEGPDLTFACILHDNAFTLGLSSYWKPSGLVAPRRPRKRPVFHPATMPPKIARCMVNLSRASPGGTFADTFSGVGGILIEAAVIGCRIIGIDANLRMLRGARRNIRHYGLEAEGYLKADARHLPIHSIDAVATDPPYGRESSTMGAKVTTLVREFLEGAKDSLKKGAHLCISTPVEVDVESYARDAAFTLKEKHLVRVHRSLTRQFVILQNT